MMQYMSQAFFFYIKTGDLLKKPAENFLQKNEKKSKYLLTDRNIGVSMYPY